jgi:ferredoxin
MDIPKMIREIAAGDLESAIRTVKTDIALPAMLGRICPELCERGCRRKDQDEPVSICLLKRYVADVDLARSEPYLPLKDGPSGKRVAVVGAGPAGLAAAWYLLQKGHAVVLLEAREAAGGAVRQNVDPERMEPAVLDAEIGLIESLGAEIRTGRTLGGNVSLDQLNREYDAVLLTIGQKEPDELEAMKLPAAQRGVEADAKTLATPLEGVFAAGGVVRPINKQAVRAVADGKHAARSIDAYLAGEPLPEISKPLSTSVGKLEEGEIEQFMQLAADAPRQAPGQPSGPLSDEQAFTEATRCLHCDCRKQESCRLRIFSQEYGASTSRYHTDRRHFKQDLDHPDVIYEAGKCILCGLCIRIAEAEGEQLGLTFTGRGFSARVGVPMGRSMSEAVQRCALRCVEACPTGALALRQASPAPAEQAE